MLNNSTIRDSVYAALGRWCREFSDSADYKLFVVGGVAINTILPPESRVKTSDIDLKLHYNHLVNVREYNKKFDEFNRLRTTIMLSIKDEVQKAVYKDTQLIRELRRTCYTFDKDYFVVAMNYKYPYLIYDFNDTANCARRYPEMRHMVMSVLYHDKREPVPISIIDLSMSVNLNNPSRLFNLPLNNMLYLTSHRKYGCFSLLKLDNGCEIANIGYLIMDLMWLSLLHHREEKRLKAQQRLNIILDHLKSTSPAPIKVQYLELLEQLLKFNYLSIGYNNLKQFYTATVKAETGDGDKTEELPPDLDVFSVTYGVETESRDTNTPTSDSGIEKLRVLEYLLYLLNVVESESRPSLMTLVLSQTQTPQLSRLTLSN